MKRNPFRFGLHFGSLTPLAGEARGFPARVAAVAQAAEEGGFDCLSVPDHVWQNDTGGGPTAPMLEAYTFLGFLSTHTKRTLLGAVVSPVMFRNPALLAKSASTVDALSDGRGMLGIGTGWDEHEMHAYGFQHPALGERMDRVEEAVRICRAMFEQEVPTFAGQYYKIQGALNFPRPVAGKMPLMIGGGGEKRTLRMVARFADISNMFGDAETLRRKIDVLNRYCEECGREPREITNTALVVTPKDRDEMLRKAEECLGVKGIDGIVVVTNRPSSETAHDWGQALVTRFG